ncbi:ribosomal protein L11 [Perkinsela sp. CCAP 1560/4]|nr:ribosomal protein L11 [Perkinsela sp. CCAP 1560/4]KNH09061.1 ribosomal protein L11 [Perkinsela sp. CCAP 1560/4]|eukprot:KNH06780.1 ribosomal protein L11 [Perkinsela sp. CCAP 1560/4]
MVRRIAKKENNVLNTKRTFTIDYSKPAHDGIFDDEHTEEFEKYLKGHVKINGKVNDLGDKVKITAHDKKMQVTSYVNFSKRYFKYLTKRFLKKKTLRDWLRVVSTSKDRYELRYYNIQQNEEEEN